MAEPFLGEIRMTGFNFNPRGWAKCDGQLLPISQNSALFSLLGTIYGGDGRTTFALPDMRGRVPIHQGNGPGLSDRRIGSKAGTQTETLNITQIPSHNHGSTALKVGVSSDDADSDDPDGAVFGVSSADAFKAAAADATMAPTSVTGDTDNNGGSQAHNNMQPYLTVNFIIALVGLFPSRS